MLIVHLPSGVVPPQPSVGAQNHTHTAMTSATTLINKAVALAGIVCEYTLSEDSDVPSLGIRLIRLPAIN